jgi:hypothetical protein
MLDTGLKSCEIDTAIRVEQTDRQQGITAAMQMHRHLRKSYGLSTTHEDALGCLTTAFEASVNIGLGKGSVDSALRSHLRGNDHWVAVLQSLAQYDNSQEAQNSYLFRIEQAFAPAKEKPPVVGALPDRSRRRVQEDDVHYAYGWDSTGSAIVQALPQADNSTLAKLLHDKHDLHGLGDMVIQARLSFSAFLQLAAVPAATVIPTGKSRYGSDPTPEEFRESNIIQVISALADTIPSDTLLEETRLAMQQNPQLSDTLQSLVAAPNADGGVSTWWEWNLCLYSMGLIDPATPSVQMQRHLLEVQAHTPNSVRSITHFPYMAPDKFNTNFGKFANTSPFLANMAFAFLLHNIPRHSKATEIWDRMKNADLSWLPKADATRYITPELLKITKYGDKDILPFAAMILPHMSNLDKARIAPIVAYGVGVQSIASFSPTTLRGMWKEHNPDAFKATIPKQYSGDTYILFALTRKNADDLMSTLTSMDVRHDIPSYLQCVETWTRQAMALPPGIDEMGPIDNLFGV